MSKVRVCELLRNSFITFINSSIAVVAQIKADEFTGKHIQGISKRLHIWVNTIHYSFFLYVYQL